MKAMLETLENKTEEAEDDREWKFMIRVAGLPNSTPEKDIYLINLSAEPYQPRYDS